MHISVIYNYSIKLVCVERGFDRGFITSSVVLTMDLLLHPTEPYNSIFREDIYRSKYKRRLKCIGLL